jgi:hypothetical protein
MVNHVIDPSADGIAPQRPSIVGLQEFGRHRTVLRQPGDESQTAFTNSLRFFHPRTHGSFWNFISA